MLNDAHPNWRTLREAFGVMVEVCSSAGQTDLAGALKSGLVRVKGTILGDRESSTGPIERPLQEARRVDLDLWKNSIEIVRAGAVVENRLRFPVELGTRPREERLSVSLIGVDEITLRKYIETYLVPERPPAAQVPAAKRSRKRPRRKGPRPGAGRYHESDKALFGEMERLISSGMTPTGAALKLALAGQVDGGGTAESRGRRLARFYSRPKKLPPAPTFSH